MGFDDARDRVGPSARATTDALSPPQRKVVQLQHDAGNRAVVHWGAQRAAVLGFDDAKDEAHGAVGKDYASDAVNVKGATMEGPTAGSKASKAQPGDAATTFDSQPSTANQLSKVQVRGYDPVKSKEIVGKAAATSGLGGHAAGASPKAKVAWGKPGATGKSAADSQVGKYGMFLPGAMPTAATATVKIKESANKPVSKKDGGSADMKEWK